MKRVRVYESQEYEQAIALAASGRLPLEKMITSVRPLADLKSAFETTMESGGGVMKILIEV